jgi:hypothetical protein
VPKIFILNETHQKRKSAFQNLCGLPKAFYLAQKMGKSVA